MEISFNLYNKNSVERLQDENPDILPDYAVDENADLAYNKEQINSAIESAIIQGKSIDGIADDLQDRLKSINESSAVKTARTAITNAQNAGTLESFYEAQELGIEIQKEWLCTQDDRTRPSHLEIDGERRDLDEEFSNGLQYPGDSSGEPGEVYNCRCTMVAYFPDEEADLEEMAEEEETGEYEEWLETKVENAGTDTGATSNGRIENEVSKAAEEYGVKYIQVYDSKELLTETQIINKLAGADETGGSCASLALAYCGQKSGYDVIDYRGGLSQDFFSAKAVIREIAKFSGVKSLCETTGNDLKSAENILNRIETGKEYYLSCGRHATIVKKIEKNGKYDNYYLELQGRTKKANGWKKFEETTLTERFFCNSRDNLGAFAVEVDSLYECREFKDILGYLNTSKQ